MRLCTLGVRMADGTYESAAGCKSEELIELARTIEQTGLFKGKAALSGKVLTDKWPPMKKFTVRAVVAVEEPPKKVRKTK